MSPEILFRALSDETRLRCVMLILQHGELCVCKFTEALTLSQPKISRHLATLKAARVLQDRREGVWVHYRLHTELPTWALTVLQQTLCGIQSREPFIRDRLNLENASESSTLCSISE
jgi:ArsR family transcriptional regulator